MKLQLQPRDIQVMKFVFACRAVTYDQIVRRHFHGIDKKTAWKRLRRLSKYGFFKISSMEINCKSVKVVQPLGTIWPAIREKWTFLIDTPHFKSESVEHDVRMAEVILRFEQLNCFRSFFPENLLQSSLALAEDPRFKDAVKLQSDGVLTFVDARGNFRAYGVELELSKKSPERYREKLVNYYLARGLDGVLYVSPEREIQRLLARVDEEIRLQRDSILHFSYERDVVSGTTPLIFTNVQGGNLELR